jgi:hypothetical protein
MFRKQRKVVKYYQLKLNLDPIIEVQEVEYKGFLIKAIVRQKEQ